LTAPAHGFLASKHFYAEKLEVVRERIAAKDELLARQIETLAQQKNEFARKVKRLKNC
jgi:hypothetical protein